MSFCLSETVVPPLREAVLSRLCERQKLLCLSQTIVPASVRGIVGSLYPAFSVHARFLLFLSVPWLVDARIPHVVISHLFRALDHFFLLRDSANQNSMSRRDWYQRYPASIMSVIQRINIFTDILETQAKTKARLEPRRCQKRESAQPLPSLEEEVASIGFIASGSSPIQGGLSSSTDVPVKSSVHISVLISTNVGIQLANSGTVGSLCFNESEARDVKKLTDLVLTSNAFPGRTSRESVQVLVTTCLEMCAVDLTVSSSLQRTFHAAWLEYRSG